MIELLPRSEEERIKYILDAIAKAVSAGEYNTARGILDLEKELEKGRRNALRPPPPIMERPEPHFATEGATPAKKVLPCSAPKSEEMIDPVLVNSVAKVDYGTRGIAKMIRHILAKLGVTFGPIEPPLPWPPPPPFHRGGGYQPAYPLDTSDPPRRPDYGKPPRTPPPRPAGRVQSEKFVPPFCSGSRSKHTPTLTVQYTAGSIRTEVHSCPCCGSKIAVQIVPEGTVPLEIPA